ncbi:hypothetical protein HOLleu_24964 [Holothuria leucospilota]|uniref:Ig-like domain-containing protein n=1 Tax=Holothuria leucospilota TaxID=206669 RepID=A0A9Q1H3M6_HOLLE|nr:hypothetical protein HOLleu_24964 [Holothuria leucospilota]
MGKSSLLCLLAMTVVSFSVYGSCSDCSPGFDHNVEGILGRNVNLTCNMKYQCDSFRWDKPEQRGVISLSGESVQVGPSKSYVPISGIGFDDDGSYRCFCYTNGVNIGMCEVYLKTICQATVTLSGRMSVSKVKLLKRFLSVTSTFI